MTWLLVCTLAPAGALLALGLVALGVWMLDQIPADTQPNEDTL